MYIQVIDMLGDVFGSGVEWFTEVITKSGMLSYYIAVVFLTLLSTFVLAPIFNAGIRAGRSDLVKKMRKKG